MEEWRPIPGYDDYEASSDGRVRSIDRLVFYAGSKSYGRKPYTMFRRGQILKPAAHGSKQNSSGHLMVMAGRGKNLEVHVAVALAFHGPRPFPKAEVLHLNNTPSDNRPGNLRWGTRGENLRMDYARGLRLEWRKSA
jgi:HNH endonuclease/NUMOD4 motif